MEDRHLALHTILEKCENTRIKFGNLHFWQKLRQRSKCHWIPNKNFYKVACLIVIVTVNIIDVIKAYFLRPIPLDLKMFLALVHYYQIEKLPHFLWTKTVVITSHVLPLARRKQSCPSPTSPIKIMLQHVVILISAAIKPREIIYTNKLL